MTSPADLDAHMRALAGEVRAEHPELDGALGTLPEFEALLAAARGSWDVTAMQRFGAYYGEVIRVACGDPSVRWVDFDTAVRTAPILGDLGRGPDLEWMLQSEQRHVFPLAKLQKFIENGGVDSPRAFAPVGVVMLAPPPASVAKPVDPSTMNADAVRFIDEFLADPSVDTLRNLAKVRTGLRREEVAYVLRDRGVCTSIWYPLFAAAAEGRGYARFVPGIVAARWVWYAIEAGAAEENVTLAELETLLTDGDKLVRRYAAYVRARVAFKRADEACVERLFARGRTPIREGVLEALASHVNDGVMGYGEYPSVEPHAPLIAQAVAKSGPVRKSAAGILQQIGGKLRRTLAPVLPSLQTLLEEGKPAEIEYALLALKGHVYSIKHGRAEWTDAMGPCVTRVVALSAPEPDKLKTTKVRIAARYALQALSSLGEALPAEHAPAVEAAFGSVSQVR